ncbi:MAG: YbjQ family protein [Gemmatimonadota bacterium]|nr:MAG: YbjQ family protein [Gemmatimonadota bacterium]
MKCEQCGKEYPSEYYFRTETVCNECYEKLTPEEKQTAHQPKLALDPSRLTTTFTLDGYRIQKYLGVVRGITVRSRSLFGTIGGSLQTLVGGNITLFTELCEKTRREAFEMMVDHAREIGANGVIGIRYDATEVMDGVTEVLCYGTAVVVESAA